MRKTFVYDEKQKKFVEKKYRAIKPRLQIMGCFDPFISPVDGTIISDRNSRREHNARNGVEDIGNDPAFRKPQTKENESKGTVEDVKKSMQQLGMD